MVKDFDENDLKKMWRSGEDTSKHEAGQVTIVGGSELFHGAPILSLRAASRIVSMVYFASPTDDRGVVENLKSQLSSFIWISEKELVDYIVKSDAVLIGPGMMRNRFEADGMVCDDLGRETRQRSIELFKRFPNKRWVVDGGSLQVVNLGELPKQALITPSGREFEGLFKQKLSADLEERVVQVSKLAMEHDLVILAKGEVTIVTNGKETRLIRGGDPGLIKGGTGDLMAGLTVGFVAKNEPVLAMAAASLLVKRASEELSQEYGQMYNPDDLAERVRQIYGRMSK